MRATAVVAMLIVGFSGLFIGVGAPTAVVLGYLAVILLLRFVVPCAARVVAAVGLAVALGFAIMRPGVEGTECDGAPRPDGFYLPVVSEIAHARIESPCASQATAARAKQRQLWLGSLTLGGVGCAGVISLLLARPRKRTLLPLPIDPGFMR